MEELKKGKEKGGKEVTFMKLKYRKKSTKTGGNFRGGERIFMAGKYIPLNSKN